MAAGVRNIIVRFTGDAKGLNNAAQGAGKEMEGWRGKLKKVNKAAVLASLAIGAAVLKVGKDSFHLSKELTELDRKAEAVFGDQLGDIRQWAEENKRAFGTSATEAVNMAAGLQDLLIPMGFARDEAAEMTKETLDLSGALASWAADGRTAEDVADTLSKAYLGNREGLKSLGISISEAEVQQRLMEKGQKDLTGEALAQAKALATQELIMEKSTDAQEAWANGGREAAEAQNASAVAIAETREKLARALTPAFEKGTKMVASFAGWAEKNNGLLLTMGGIVAGLAGAVLAVNAAIKVWNALKVVAAAAQWAWNVAMSANPIGLIVIGIVALIAIVVLLVKHWDKVKAAAQAAWGWIWDKLKAFGQWFKRTFWENGIKKAFDAHNRAVQRVRDIAAGAFDWVRSKAQMVRDFITGIPGKIRSGFSNLRSIVLSPFKAAFNAVAGFWNRTVGKISFQTPDWVPGFGGKGWSMPTIPTFHSGGVIPGVGERLIRANAGERLVTREADLARGEGDTHVTVVIDGRALDESLMRVSSRRDRSLKRRTLAGAGAAR